MNFPCLQKQFAGRVGSDSLPFCLNPRLHCLLWGGRHFSFWVLPTLDLHRDNGSVTTAPLLADLYPASSTSVVSAASAADISLSRLASRQSRK
jgi:hypothetical protein